MVGMSVGLNEPVDLQPFVFHKLDNLIGRFCFGAARFGTFLIN
jgi:hypothetical protein